MSEAGYCDHQYTHKIHRFALFHATSDDASISTASRCCKKCAYLFRLRALLVCFDFGFLSGVISSWWLALLQALASDALLVVSRFGILCFQAELCAHVKNISIDETKFKVFNRLSLYKIYIVFLLLALQNERLLYASKCHTKNCVVDKHNKQ